MTNAWGMLTAEKYGCFHGGTCRCPDVVEEEAWGHALDRGRGAWHSHSGDIWVLWRQIHVDVLQSRHGNVEVKARGVPMGEAQVTLELEEWGVPVVEAWGMLEVKA